MNDLIKEEIKYYLYNYNNIDKLIKDRKNQIIELGNISYYDWLTKKISIEDIVNNLDEDILIRKYKIIKESIIKLLEDLKYEYPIQYRYVYYKYIKKYDKQKVESILKSSNIESIDMLDYIILIKLYKIYKIKEVKLYDYCL